MGEVLFLAHRIPFPPDRGDKVRSHHLLKAIAALAPVHVATLADDRHDAAAEGDLAAVAQSYCLAHRTKSLARAGIEALARRKPVSLAAFRHPRLTAYVDEILATRPISAIYVFSGQMGQYVPATFAGRVIVDLVDVDSAKFDAYAATGALPMRWVNAREGRLLRAEEARLAARADKTLLISHEEASLFASRLSPARGVAATIDVLPNGIDADFYDPDLVEAEPRLTETGSPRLIFTGQMDYAPNIAAARRAIERILPLVREALPNASLHIVGRNPPGALTAYDGVAGCRIWGRVPDIRPWLKGADIALVPLEIARGVQNKVLEAMAMSIPVVLTPGSATGISADDRKHFHIADSDHELASAIVTLAKSADDRRQLGRAARQFVLDRMSWPAACARLAALLNQSEAAMRDAA